MKLKTLLRSNTGASGKFEGLVTSKQGRGNLREKMLASLVTRAEHLEIARGYETRLSSFLNVLSKMDNHRGLQDEKSSENWTDCVSAIEELRYLRPRNGVGEISKGLS